MTYNSTFFDDIQTTQRLVVSSVASAALIENQFSNFLLPPPAGVYKIGEVDACMVSGEPYFYEEDKGLFYTDKAFFQYSGKTIQPIVNINDVNSAVYDKTGRIVIPAFMMQDKAQYLSSTPTVPCRGVVLVELLIKNYLDSISNIPGKRSYGGRVERHIKQEYADDSVIDSLEVICKTLFLHIEQFVGDDLWHIYYVKRIQFDIVIEKTIDYRIHFYNTQHNTSEKTDDAS